MDGVEAEFAGRVNVTRLNAVEPENDRLLQSYGFRGHPSIAIVDGNGQVVERFYGEQTAETLRQALEKLLD